MTAKAKNIVWTTIVCSIVAALFIYTFIVFLRRGEGVLYSLFAGIFVTVATIVLIPLLYIVWWRIFTPNGREDEKVARARWEIRKLEIIRDKEYRSYFGSTSADETSTVGDYDDWPEYDDGDCSDWGDGDSSDCDAGDGHGCGSGYGADCGDGNGMC